LPGDYGFSEKIRLKNPEYSNQPSQICGYTVAAPVTLEKPAFNGSNRKDFLTPFSLIFQLTGQGRSVAKWRFLILGKRKDIDKVELNGL